MPGTGLLWPQWYLPPYHYHQHCHQAVCRPQPASKKYNWMHSASSAASVKGHTQAIFTSSISFMHSSPIPSYFRFSIYLHPHPSPIPIHLPSLPLALNLTPHLTFFADSTICIQLSPSLVTSCLGYDLHSPTRLICHSTTPYSGPTYSFPATGPNPNPAHLSTSLFNHHQSEKWSQPEMSSISLHRSCLTLSFSSSLFFCSRIPASAVAVSSLPPGCMGWCQIKSLTTWDTFFLIV